MNVVYLAASVNYTMMVAWWVMIYGAWNTVYVLKILGLKLMKSTKEAFSKASQIRKNDVEAHLLLSSSMASNGMTAQIFISLDCSSPEEHSGNFL